MRTIVAVILAIAFPASSFSEWQAREDAEQTVRNSLQVLSRGFYTGSTEKGLETLGDASAIAIITIYSDRDLSSDDIKAVLLVLNFSFSAPKLVIAEADRKPRATMLLLRYLDSQTRQPELMEKIAETKRAIEKSVRQLGS